MNNNQFINKIENANTIAIIGHIRPDGDCVGSCLGLYNYIKDNYEDKEACVYLQSIPAKFTFLKGADKIKNQPDDCVYDLAVSLDCGDRFRHGEFADVFSTARDTICLDHHRSNEGFGDYYYCDPDASSACEILYRHIDSTKISSYCAEALYLGIVHDTGVFKYSCTSEETMKIAGHLLTLGARSQYIIDETFYKVNYNQNKLTGLALTASRLHLDGKVISTCVTLDMFKECNAIKDDTDGIVDKIRVTDGVEVAIFVYQTARDTYKFSLRSVSYVDVSKIAVAYGGGGHIRAAGFEATGSYEDNLRDILNMIKEQL